MKAIKRKNLSISPNKLHTYTLYIVQKYGIIRHKKNYFLKIESSLNILLCKYYFLAKKPSTFSGCIIDSTNV
ncbi:MAG: hypothetical protein ACI9JT_000330 [Polaribacter sp.]|jgi:hypothetical protein